MLYDFFNKYFTSAGYNAVNTAVYALLFMLGTYVIFLLLKKMKVRIDKRFAVAVAPFVLFGSSMRVLVDSNVIESFLFVSPTIYLIITAFTLACVVASLFLEKKCKIPYHKTLFVMGLIASLLPLSIIKFTNFYAAFLIFLFLLPWLALLAIAKWPKENKLVSLIHIFDSTTTAVSLEFFGYTEQHVVPNIFIRVFGPFSFVAVKAIAIFLILVVIDRYCKNRKFRNYLKLVIGILGAATGTRDFLRLLALT